MKAETRAKLIERVKAIAGLTDDERGDLLELLRTQKTYGLVWEDKPEDVEERLRDELPVLIEDKSKALTNGGNDAPNHILIEGDNLEALTTLAYTHAGKIDVIYIDPPYNTGNKDFIYNDSYVDSEDTYRHSKWLSFMNKRLRIAKKLLSDRGVIFISIDDNEQANLKLLCDEVFGEKNMLVNLIWKSKSGGANDSKYFAVDHEYILVYAKKANELPKFMDNQAEVTTSYNFSDEHGFYSLDRLDKQSIRYSDSLNYEIVDTEGNSYWPKHKDPKHPNATWRWSKETVQQRFDELVFRNGNVYTKNYKKESNIARSLLIEERFGRTRTGKTDLAAIFDMPIFTAPKPPKLIWHLLNISNCENSTILDFFAGSGTTMHAVMQLNAEDGGHRQCILVTNNENGICENVTYERNKRVINGYTKPNGEAVEGLHGNNLRYYRTDFVGRSRSPQNLRKLVRLATDMLCIKEDLYAEHQAFAGQEVVKQAFRYFEKGDKRMLIIYREEAVPLLVPLIEKFELPRGERIKVYVFSPSEDPWAGDFEDVQDKVELCALPMAILNAYKRVLPKRKEQNIYVDPDMVPEQAEENAPSDSLFPEMEGGDA